MSQQFKALLRELHHTKQQPNPRYYHILLSNAKLILLEITMRNQGQVAKDLNMSTSKLSNIVSILKEYIDA